VPVLVHLITIVLIYIEGGKRKERGEGGKKDEGGRVQIDSFETLWLFHDYFGSTPYTCEGGRKEIRKRRMDLL